MWCCVFGVWLIILWVADCVVCCVFSCCLFYCCILAWFAYVLIATVSGLVVCCCGRLGGLFVVGVLVWLVLLSFICVWFDSAAFDGFDVFG